MHAETFTVSLQPQETTGPYGTYLSAPFDFETEFSNIDLITLQFMMPAGYEGYFASTGNSFYSRSLEIVVHDIEMPVTNIWSLDIATALRASASDLDANEAAEFRFRQVFNLGDEQTPVPWPSFLTGGAGHVSFFDVFYSSHRPPSGDTIGNSSTSWLPLGELAAPTLTIVGTPVPEPATAVLLVASLMLIAVVRLTVFHFGRRTARTVTLQSPSLISKKRPQGEAQADRQVMLARFAMAVGIRSEDRINSIGGVRALVVPPPGGQTLLGRACVVK